MPGWPSSADSGPLTSMRLNATSTACINQRRHPYQQKHEQARKRRGPNHGTTVGVRMTIAHDSFGRTGRAGFPHPALALGDKAHAPQGIGMTKRSQGQPASDETPHAIRDGAAVSAQPRQRATPMPTDSGWGNRERRAVRRHPAATQVSTHNRPRPLAVFGLAHSLTASASRSNCLARLDAGPARSSVNAPTPPSRAAPHDSRPM
jgi:hypothetical protein